ncbi:MAG: ATP-binding protein [Pirellulaceae bacterium]
MAGHAPRDHAEENKALRARVAELETQLAEANARLRHEASEPFRESAEPTTLELQRAVPRSDAADETAARSRDRQQVEVALEDSITLYHSLVEHLPVCVYRIDLDGRLTFGNSAYLRDVGRPLEDLLGKTVFDIFPEEEAHKYAADDGWVMETGQDFHDVEEHDVRSEKLYVEVLKSRVHDHQGRPVGVQGLYWDVSARKRAEEQLQRSMAELERSNKELQRFAAVASHDMHAPLRRIVTAIQRIQEHCCGRVDAETSEYLEFIVSSVDHMQKLIDVLLAHSRIGAADRPLELVDCGAAVSTALMSLEPSICECGAEVSVGDLPTLVANRVEMVQLFQNLIGNAVKYHCQGTPFVDVQAEPDENHWLFRVKDNGIGIPGKDCERIFEAFQRLHDEGKYPGTGIGLATCKKIVEQLDGKIWVESRPGEGCEFLFTLPARPAPSPS